MKFRAVSFFAASLFVLFISIVAKPCTGTLLDGTIFNPYNYKVSYPSKTVTILSGTTVISGQTPPQTNASGGWTFCDTNNLGNYSIQFTIRINDANQTFTFKWITDKDGYYNVADFGVLGNMTDEKNGIQSAIYYVASRNGGKLNFPKGYFRTSEGFVLPSGIIIEGNNRYDFSSCRLELAPTTPVTSEKYLFKVGEKTRGISINDIHLTTNAVGSPGYIANTQGILAEGYFSSNATDQTASFGLVLRDLTISGFEKGIEVRGLDVDKGWQLGLVRVDHASIFQCKECLRLETANTDWHISNSIFGAVENGIGINVIRAGTLLIQHVVGAGPTHYFDETSPDPIPVPIGSPHAADTFLNIIGRHGPIKIDSTQTEQFRNAIVVDYEDYDAAILVANSSFGDKIIFKKNATYVSVGSTYLSDTFETWVAGERQRFVDGTPYAKRKIRGPGCFFPNDCCALETGGVPLPPTGSNANNVKIYSTGDTFLNFNRYYCVNSFDTGETYPADFIISGTSSVLGVRSTTILPKIVGVGAVKPGAGIFGTPSVLEIEAKDGNLPWMVLNRSGASSGNRRWGWVVGGDGNLYLQDIGNNGNLFQFDTNGNLVPPTNNTGQIGTDSQKWAKVRASIIQPNDIILTDMNTGEKLYVIKEDSNHIYFTDYRTGKEMMRIDKDGNLYVRGKVFQGFNPEAKRKTTPVRNRRKARRK